MTPTFAVITGPEIAVLVGLAILLFGADRIPKLARSMGEAKKEFEAAQRGQNVGTTPPEAASGPTTSPTATSPAQGVPPAPVQPPAPPQ